MMVAVVVAVAVVVVVMLVMMVWFLWQWATDFYMCFAATIVAALFYSITCHTETRIVCKSNLVWDLFKVDWI